jgi:hypothetical protein
MVPALLRTDGLRAAMALVLLVAVLAIGGGAVLRSAEYDEGYTSLVTSPDPRPAWPAGIFTPREVAPVLEAVVPPAEVSRQLRETDVHPPLYFWAAGLLRQAGLTELGALRAFSVACAVAAVAAFMAAARLAGIPPLAAGLLTALSYGFAYTGGVARGFALAHLMLGLAALATVLAWRRGGTVAGVAAAAAAGLAAGLASFANYLAAFPAAALLGWLLIAPGLGWARVKLLVAAALPFLAVQAGNLSYFLPQRGSRPEQFEPFAILPAVKLLGQFNAANLFGGLPLYAEGLARVAIGGALAGLLLAGAIAVAWRWRGLGPTRWLWLGGFAAPSAGLLLLGALAGNTPVELRYLAFAAPFAALLLAGAAGAVAQRHPRAALAGLGLLLAVQGAGILGMALHPATRQAYRDAMAALAPSLGPQALLLVPRGNDGVGIVVATLREAPPDQPMLLLRDGTPLPPSVEPYRRLVILGITDRDGARQVEAALAALRADPAWREAPVPWRDARRGFAAHLFEAAPPRASSGVATSGVADLAEGIVIGRAHDRGEEP